MITQLSLFMHLLLLAPAFKVQQRHSSCWSENIFSCAGSPKVAKMPLLWLEKNKCEAVSGTRIIRGRDLKQWWDAKGDKKSGGDDPDDDTHKRI